MAKIENNTTTFFQLIQVAIGKCEKQNVVPTQEEWAQLLVMAKKQSLAGLCFTGIEKLPQEQSPSEDLIMEWMGEAVKAQRRNKKIFQIKRHRYLKNDIPIEDLPRIFGSR